MRLYKHDKRKCFKTSLLQVALISSPALRLLYYFSLIIFHGSLSPSPLSMSPSPSPDLYSPIESESESGLANTKKTTFGLSHCDQLLENMQGFNNLQMGQNISNYCLKKLWSTFVFKKKKKRKKKKQKQNDDMKM